MKFNFNLGLVSAIAAFVLTGCLVGQNEQYFEPVPSACNPFGDGISGLGRSNGVRGKLFYFDDADLALHPHSQFSDFKDHGQLARANFYFNNINVPTRRFDQGFELSNGKLLSKSDGTPLFEHFAFDFTTNIKLPAGSGSRQVQFAVLADDGANLLVQDPITQVWTKQVMNDGVHPTVLTCGSSPITINDQPTALNFQYFQGPRYEIAMVLLWRPWNGSASDPMCDSRMGFFNTSTTPSTPTAKWIDVMSRWEVVPANMLYMDANDENPCNH